MNKIFVINDFNDINTSEIRHYSLDKGHYLAISLAKLNQEIYFLTTNNNYEKNNIKYISIININEEFIKNLDYILIIRETTIIEIARKIPIIRKYLNIENETRKKPKFIIKSDSPAWFTRKYFISEINHIFDKTINRKNISKWIVKHINFICVQNEIFYRQAQSLGLEKKSIIETSMGVPNNIENKNITNPYDINHNYCVNLPTMMKNNRALIPYYYLNNPDKKNDFNNKKKYNIVYTGRIKTDGGKILNNMLNIMNILGDEYELHIFPGRFIIPGVNKGMVLSPKNSNNLELLRNTIFKDSKNIIIHYPYLHEDKYSYLLNADCGIDFSDVRPSNNISCAGHAKILEYCECGLPIVCEKNIQNLYLIERGKNGIILPYKASDNEYAEAIKKIVTMNIDREYCKKVTIENENWDKKAEEFLKYLN